MTRQLTAKKLLRYGSIILLVLVIGGYGIWSSRDLIFGIKLSVVGITDGMTVATPVIEFSGTAVHADTITIDGRIVPLSQKGDWNDSIALLSGHNTVTISATDKFQRTISKHYQIYYKQ
jgi:hypothetical protein